MARKRSIELTFRTIVILILLLAVLMVGILIFTKYTSKGQTFLNDILDKTEEGKNEVIDQLDNAFGDSDSS